MRLALLQYPWLVLLIVAEFGEDPRKLDPRSRRVAELIGRLDDDSFENRQAAAASLIEIGEPALPQLRTAAVESEDPETRERAQRLMRRIVVLASKSPATELQTLIVEPGEFQMGSPRDEGGRQADEFPHKVRITRLFLIGQNEVTQQEFEKVMKFQPSWFSRMGGGKDNVAKLATEEFPVENVTWFDALEFCNRLSALDGYQPYYNLTNVEKDGESITAAKVAVLGGNGYRLPTEAEWEYACRAGTQTPYHYGYATNAHSSNVKGVTTTGYGGPVRGPNLARTTNVGSYDPNAWGLYNMHGNAAEWCWDGYAGDYYAASPKEDPTGPEVTTNRVLRGGSWLVGEESSRSATRLTYAPWDRKYFTGFRVARTP